MVAQVKTQLCTMRSYAKEVHTVQLCIGIKAMQTVKEAKAGGDAVPASLPPFRGCPYRVMVVPAPATCPCWEAKHGVEFVRHVVAWMAPTQSERSDAECISFARLLLDFQMASRPGPLYNPMEWRCVDCMKAKSIVRACQSELWGSHEMFLRVAILAVLKELALNIGTSSDIGAPLRPLGHFAMLGVEVEAERREVVESWLGQHLPGANTHCAMCRLPMGLFRGQAGWHWPCEVG